MQTDWDSYYKQPYKAAKFTRKITTNILITLIKRFIPNYNSGIRIGELGGANSCFYSAIQEIINPIEYTVIDNNKLGLNKLVERVTEEKNISCYNEDILNIDRDLKLDLVFSIGLVEHFTPDDTRKAIHAHFRLVKPGGIVIISFPTPTFLYKITRMIAEISKLWIFHDERPMLPNEAINAISDRSEVLYQKTIWPIFLTQHIVVAKKLPRSLS